MNKLMIALSLKPALLLFLLVSCALPAEAADKIYAAMEGDAGIAVIDAQTLDAWGNIKSGHQAAKLKASQDGRFVYVSLQGEGKVKLIDASTDAVVNEVKTGDAPYNMDLTPDGKLLLVLNDRSSNLSVIDTASFKELKRVPLGGMPQDIKISPDGETAYLAVGDPDSTLAVFDVNKMEVVRKVNLPGRVYDLALSPKGDRLYVKSMEAGKILIIDASTLKTLGGIECGEFFGLALTSDGSEIWFPGPENSLTAYSIKDNKVIAKMPCPGTGAPMPYLTFSPDRKLAFVGPVGAEGRMVYVYDVAKRKKTGEIKLPAPVDGIEYLSR